MNKSMRIALIHMGVHYKKPEVNRRNLFDLNREAAINGADIILNTELSTTGYSFNSREDISEYVETYNGSTVTKLAEIAEKYSKYIGIGLAERDEDTEIYYNSAVLIGPNGRPICKYRKVNAEARWACPGDSRQENTCDTPWGRIGILICSDTYYGLFPRSMALKGVDLLWVPANWPPGSISPQEVWKARALENGFFLAACNRTGQDRVMDCRDAVSCVYDPQGRELLSASSRDSRVLIADLPLDENGKLSRVLRNAKVGKRTPGRYGSIYLDLRLVDDLTAHYGLPEPAPMQVHCIVPAEAPFEFDSLERQLRGLKGEGAALAVLPSLPIAEKAALHALARRSGVALCAAFIRGSSDGTHVMVTPHGEHGGNPAGTDAGMDGRFPFPMMHYGPAKIAMAPFNSLVHPELAVVFSKLGCDLVVLSEERLENEGRLLCAVKTVEGVAVAVCASNGGLIAMVPRGHEPWEERSVEGAGICSYEIDIARTRKKRFQDRVDFELLLRNST